LLSPIITVPSSVWRIVVSGCGRNGMVRSVTTIWPRVGHRGIQTDHRRERLVGIAGSKHDLGSAELACGVVRQIRRPLLLIAETGRFRKIVVRRLEARVERTKRPQRIDVAVELRAAKIVLAAGNATRRSRRWSVCMPRWARPAARSW